jgi:hypothetical protein
MTDQQMLSLIGLAERHFRWFVNEAKVMFDSDLRESRLDRFTWKEGDYEIIPPDKIHEVMGQSLEATASWTPLETLNDMTQRWPDGNVDSYDTFIVYGNAAAFPGVRLGIGTASTEGKEGERVGFVMGTGTSKRPLTVFFPAEDVDQSRELLSLIRGNKGGRGTFAPTEQLPIEYAGFKTDVLGARIPGKWNVRAVVVRDDEEGVRMMLNHTAIQARLRGLI